MGHLNLEAGTPVTVTGWGFGRYVRPSHALLGVHVVKMNSGRDSYFQEKFIHPMVEKEKAMKFEIDDVVIAPSGLAVVVGPFISGFNGSVAYRYLEGEKMGIVDWCSASSLKRYMTDEEIIEQVVGRYFTPESEIHAKAAVREAFHLRDECKKKVTT